MNYLIFLGTASGIAEKERFHSQIYFKCEKYNLLIDAPDACSKAIASAGENPNDISGILISHFHPDHVSGIALLLQQMKLTERKKKLEIFVHREMKSSLLKLLELTYIFPDKLKFPLEIVEFDENRKITAGENLAFTAFRNNHIRNKYGVKTDTGFVSVSFYIETKSSAVVVTSDVASERELFVFPKKKIKYFITEWTHVELDAIKKVSEHYDIEKLLITHYSIKKAVNFTSSEKISLAYDKSVYKL